MKNSSPECVLVTGASSGIGAAIARRQLEQGRRVIACARRLALMEQAFSEFSADQLHLLEVDVADRQQVQEKISAAMQTFGVPDVLVNNAGVCRDLAPLADGIIDDWDEMIATNVQGLLYVTQTVLKEMVKKSRGHIVNIGSTSSFATYPGGAVYCATKHAVLAITRGLKKDLEGTPIRVTSVDPGMVETNFSVVRFKGDVERAKAVYQDITPLQAEDVAETVEFVITRPAHVNVAHLIVTATEQKLPF